MLYICCKLWICRWQNCVVLLPLNCCCCLLVMMLIIKFFKRRFITVKLCSICRSFLLELLLLITFYWCVAEVVGLWSMLNKLNCSNLWTCLSYRSNDQCWSNLMALTHILSCCCCCIFVYLLLKLRSHGIHCMIKLAWSGTTLKVEGLCLGLDGTTLKAYALLNASITWHDFKLGVLLQMVPHAFA